MVSYEGLPTLDYVNEPVFLLSVRDRPVGWEPSWMATLVDDCGTNCRGRSTNGWKLLPDMGLIELLEQEWSKLIFAWLSWMRIRSIWSDDGNSFIDFSEIVAGLSGVYAWGVTALDPELVFRSVACLSWDESSGVLRSSPCKRYKFWWRIARAECSSAASMYLIVSSE